jgi:hypothetical protein
MLTTALQLPRRPARRLPDSSQPPTHRTDRPQNPKNDLRWLHLDGINHLHEKLSVQEAPDRVTNITCRERTTTYDHSTDLGTYLDLGVMACSIGATTEGGDIE